MAGRVGLVAALPAVRLAVLLGACAEPRTDPERTKPDSGSSTAGTTAAGVEPTGVPPRNTDTGPVGIDSGSLPPGYPAPDCTRYVLPGPHDLVAATPRPDHDAEVLALALDPTAVAAAPADYDTITADLGAIRALDPTLADVHVGCVVPNGIAFWFFDHEDVNHAIWADDYHAWDCHDGYFGLRQRIRIDDLAVVLELDGVYGQIVWDSYAALPGLADHEPYWFQRSGWPTPTTTGPDCEPAAGSIELTATRSPDGALDERHYRFEPENGEPVEYTITADEPSPG